MVIGRIRWWWLQLRHRVLLPFEMRGRDACYPLDSSTREVPLVAYHGQLGGPTAPSWEEVHETSWADGRIGTARYRRTIRRKRQRWAVFVCDIPLDGRSASGDWRAKNDRLALAAICLTPNPGFPLEMT